MDTLAERLRRLGGPELAALDKRLAHCRRLIGDRLQTVRDEIARRQGQKPRRAA